MKIRNFVSLFKETSFRFIDFLYCFFGGFVFLVFFNYLLLSFFPLPSTWFGLSSLCLLKFHREVLVPALRPSCSTIRSSPDVPLNASSGVLHSFHVVLCLYFKIFPNCYVISSLTHRYLKEHCLIFIDLVVSQVSLHCWTLALLWSGNILCMIEILSNVLRFVYWPSMWSILENVSCVP